MKILVFRPQAKITRWPFGCARNAARKIPPIKHIDFLEKFRRGARIAALRTGEERRIDCHRQDDGRGAFVM
jgi:hypothetical protein